METRIDRCMNCAHLIPAPTRGVPQCEIHVGAPQRTPRAVLKKHQELIATLSSGGKYVMLSMFVSPPHGHTRLNTDGEDMAARLFAEIFPGRTPPPRERNRTPRGGASGFTSDDLSHVFHNPAVKIDMEEVWRNAPLSLQFLGSRGVEPARAPGWEWLKVLCRDGLTEDPAVNSFIIELSRAGAANSVGLIFWSEAFLWVGKQNTERAQALERAAGLQLTAGQTALLARIGRTTAWQKLKNWPKVD